MLILTKEEVAQARLKALKQAVKGSDVRCHNGARPLVHRDKKREAKNAKFDKRALED